MLSRSAPFNGWVLPAVRLSDHASFWDNGYKAVMITDSAYFRNPHYHQASDTMDKLDYRFMAELVESLMLFFQSLNLQVTSCMLSAQNLGILYIL